MSSQKPAAADKPVKIEGFSEEEKAALKERIREEKEQARASSQAEIEASVLARIEKMPEPDRSMALKVHQIVKANAPELTSRLWYGMPAYSRDTKVICFFQDAAKFKTRYSTLGFSDGAKLDDGTMWPVSYALIELTPEEEAKICALIKKAVG